MSFLCLFIAQVGLPFSMVAGGDVPSVTPTPTPTPPITRVATPVISPASGAPPRTVTLTCATTGATIFYTVSGGGTAPTHSGATALGSTRTYTGSFTTGSGTQRVVEALGYKDGLTDSIVAVVVYESSGGGGQ
jgi:Chitobiase/beta-hexosaminidase C-terminal domain